ncbi:MAG: DUF4041 domain-containing protein [Tepidisphaera sp.]|nr:DUF4041 domain-containing protein [Tepidisphaera sp.]
METLLKIALATAGVVLTWLGVLLVLTRWRAARAANAALAYRAASEQKIHALQEELKRLEPWSSVADADEYAKRVTGEANETLERARREAAELVASAQRESDAMRAEAKSQAANDSAETLRRAAETRTAAQTALTTATTRAAQIVAEAERKAQETAGKAMDAVRNAEAYERTARAMKRLIEGYGDEYLVPPASLLDDLAAEFGHKDAGEQLAMARELTRSMVKSGQAARCEYVSDGRREGAERFVLDAFNGKVDSILSRTKHDNYGKLAQEIRDAFAVVNLGGEAFRKARIMEAYLDARLSELKWGAVVQELKRQEQEEQRRVREQIREEEKARREFERAIRDAAKEEEIIRKAMAKAQAQIEEASAEQRVKYEAQLAELTQRLGEAEARNQRALSMAQQTRRGHVYIISNVGSFGEDVYKIGLTRRLEPMDRIRELGDASVPFDFDVHAIILSDDAPALETKLHKHFLLRQVNKVNHRKEFFRAALSDIRSEIESLGVEARWTMLSEAKEFRESQAIERAIEKDPVARDAWLNRQLTLEPATPISELQAAADE